MSRKEYTLFFVAVIVSAILIFCKFNHTDIINDDGVLYLYVSKLFISSGYHAAMTAYPWPFYMAVTVLVSKVLNISLFSAAVFQNIAYFVLTVLLFLLILKRLGATFSELCLGLLLILLFNTFIRQYHQIIRDTSYWFFYLLSVYLYLWFTRKKTFPRAIAWSIAAIIACLYRIEGVILLFLIPWTEWIQPAKSFYSRCRAFVYLNCLAGVFFILIVSYLLVSHSSTHALGRLWQVKKMIFSDGIFYNYFMTPIHTLHDQVMSRTSIEYSSLGYGVLLVSVYLWVVFITYSLVFWVLTGTAVLKRLMPVSKQDQIVLLVYVLSNIAVTFCFMMMHSFELDHRYLIPLCLTLLLYAPFGLRYLFNQWRGFNPRSISWRSWLFPLVVLLLLVKLVQVFIHFGPTKNYIYHGSQWINKNTPQNAVIFTNVKPFQFYVDGRTTTGWMCDREPFLAIKGGKCFQWSNLNPEQWAGSDYLVLDVGRGDQAQFDKLQAALKLKSVANFDQKHRHHLYIFKLK